MGHTLTKANEYHRCRWPYGWKKTGEEEHGCKCDLTCQNGGEIDEDSCTCKCPADEFHGWTGVDCSQPFGTCQVGPNSGNQHTLAGEHHPVRRTLRPCRNSKHAEKPYV